MKRMNYKWLGIGIICILLVVTFFWGGDYAKGEKADSEPAYSIEETENGESVTDLEKSEDENSSGEYIEKISQSSDSKKDEKVDNQSEAQSETEKSGLKKTESGESETKQGKSKSDQGDKHLSLQGIDEESKGEKDKYLTDPIPEGKPHPIEPQDAIITKNAKTCTISIVCDTILDNMDDLDPEKVELVPKDGVILPPTKVTFYEGESVFNLLRRETKKNKIHMEFENTPIYNSAYIEGIHNLYEFDCGELSGWMYKVNNWFPNYGCSRYQIKDKDVIVWVYTCDLGRDVGDGFYEQK
ncbi:MAG: DUF4430 domain-containing protein [Anaerovorax sp.]|nr:DUF4430 domain-containing protein [Anaerovorax sp.]